MTNEELAKKANNGDNKALSELYSQTRRLLYALAVKYYNNHSERCTAAGVEVSDLANESYFALREAVGVYCKKGGEYKFTTFLKYPVLNRFNELTGYRIKTALNEPLNNCRSLDEVLQGADTETTLGETIADETAEFEDDVIQNIAKFEIVRDIKKALADNSQGFEVLYLYYFKGMKYREIGEKIGVSATYVRDIIKRTLNKLRRKKEVREYGKDVISSSIRIGGVGRFKHTLESSTEWAARKLIEKEQKNNL